MNTLYSIFSQCHTGALLVGMDTVTIPTLLKGKKNPMQGRIKKVMTGAVVMVNRDYENSRNKQLLIKGFKATFKALPRKWGIFPIAKMPIVTNKGEIYLNTSIMRAGIVTYLLDDKPIEKAKIEGLKESKGAGIPEKEVKKQLADMTGAEKEVLAGWHGLVFEAITNPSSVVIDKALIKELNDATKEVYYRDFKTESITAIRVNKQEFTNISTTEV